MLYDKTFPLKRGKQVLQGVLDFFPLHTSDTFLCAMNRCGKVVKLVKRKKE